VRAAFHALFGVIAQAIVKLHNVTGPVFGRNSGLSWALAIMLLTIIVRGLMYPLFVKQIKTQRAMTALQPKIKELQAKHKGDKETLNTELMKLYKEHNANPFAGCLPVLLQMPIFISLFQVLKQLEPSVHNGAYRFPSKFGVSPAVARSLGRAKLFGAPIGAGFKSPAKLLAFLNTSPGPVKAVSLVLIVAMAATTFITSKQMMGKNATSDPSQATQQKLLLYLMPAMLGLFGFNVAIGVLIYWTTTNLFSMVQQAVVMRHLGPVDATPAKAASASGRGAAGSPAKPGANPRATRGAKSGAKPGAQAAPASSTAARATPAVAAADGASVSPDVAAPPASTPRPASRNSKRGKGQRRGGRR
jgi:YidC/Oxa1 family membrane protein insertase